MWNPPTKIQLSKLPKLYSQEKEKDPKVYIKFFMGSFTWYAIEFDGRDRFFGWVINEQYPEGAELGYFSLAELKSINVGGVEVDREIYGITPLYPKRLSEVKKRHRLERGSNG